MNLIHIHIYGSHWHIRTENTVSKAPGRRGNVRPPSRPGPNSSPLETIPGSRRPARLPALGSYKIFLASSTWSPLLPTLLISYLQILSAPTSL